MQNSYVIYAVNIIILYNYTHLRDNCVVYHHRTKMAEAATIHTCRATYCFGCGNEVKPDNRRKLDNEEAKNVVLVWKAFLEDEGHLIGEDVSLDAILN